MKTINKQLTLTVSQLNDYVKALIDSSEFLSNVCVVGEISNFTNHYKTGHFYFTLKDENSLVKAVMFRTYASRVRFVPQNNMKVLVYGRISVFPRDGVYQLYAEEMEQFGIGDLYAAFEQMKNKLSALGMFDERHKKPIPKFPRRIGIITSPEAAAVADMKNILTRRYPLCEIHIYPALVQGKDAPRELCDGIIHFDLDEKCDTIIIGRGGGSIEDLWAFNDETLARTIFACRTPVISAVGHETDFTICDFVSDLRAPTPSAAAELAVPDMTQLLQQLAMTYRSMYNSVSGIISQKKLILSALSERKSLKSPMFYVDSHLEELSFLDRRISGGMENIMKSKSGDISHIASRLTALNPMAVLSRGYAAVFSGDGSVLTSAKNVKKGEKITLSLNDGKINASVDGVTLSEEK